MRRDAGVQVAGDAAVTALSRRGRRTVILRPPVGTAVACTVPPCTAAIDETRVRPRPKPSWRGGAGGRGGGRDKGAGPFGGGPTPGCLHRPRGGAGVVGAGDRPRAR